MTKSETITVRVNEEDKRIIQHYSSVHGISSSELLKQATMEKIEDEIDLKAYNEAMAEFEKDKTTYSIGEVDKMLGL